MNFAPLKYCFTGSNLLNCSGSAKTITSSGITWNGFPMMAIHSPTPTPYIYSSLSNAHKTSSILRSSSSSAEPEPLQQPPKKSPDFMAQTLGSKSVKGHNAAQKAAPVKRGKPIDNKSSKQALHHCIELTKKHDFANYIGALLMPAEVQPAIFALLAFNVELAVIRDRIERNTGTTGIYRLQFWKDTIEAIFGEKRGPIPKQPVALALQRFVLDVDVELLSSLISARQETLGDRAFTSVEAVQQYGQKTHGVMIRLMMHVLLKNKQQLSKSVGKSYDITVKHHTIEAVNALAGAMALLTLLRTAMPLLARGIVLLPEDLMQIHGLDADSFYTNKKPEAARLLARDITATSSLLLNQARALRNEVPCAVRTAFIPTSVTIKYLVKILQKCDYNLLDARLQRAPNLMAWRVWWRSIFGHY